MKIYSIQNNSTTLPQNKTSRVKQRAFRGQLLAQEILNVRTPNNVKDWAAGFSKLITAVKNDSEVKIVNNEFFEKMMAARESIDALTVFIGKNIIDILDVGEGANIAYDQYGNSALAVVKDIVNGENRQFVQFSDSCHHAQYGLADANLGAKRFKFYKDDDLYVDFYDLRNVPDDLAKSAADYSNPKSSLGGGIRKISPHMGDATYYKEDGSRDYFGGLKSLFNMS